MTTLVTISSFTPLFPVGNNAGCEKKRGWGGGVEERAGGIIKIGFQFILHGSGALTDTDVMSFLSVTLQT